MLYYFHCSDAEMCIILNKKHIYNPSGDFEIFSFLATFQLNFLLFLLFDFQLNSFYFLMDSPNVCYVFIFEA